MPVNPVYDLKQPEERLRLYRDQPNAAARAVVVDIIRRLYGARAAEALGGSHEDHA